MSQMLSTEKMSATKTSDALLARIKMNATFHIMADYDPSYSIAVEELMPLNIY